MNFVENISFVSGINQDYSSYILTGKDINYEVDSGKHAHIVFSDDSVRIYDSYIFNKEERFKILKFISYYVDINGINCDRTLNSMEGEWMVHSLLYELGIATSSTKDADIEFTRDSRWYVYYPSVFMQILSV